MKSKMKILCVLGVAALFVAMALVPAISGSFGANNNASTEKYNKQIDDYILGIDYDADNCIVSTDGVSVQQQYSFSGDDEQTTTTKYEKVSISNNGSSVLSNLGSQTTKVYPGAILKADTDLANGTPNAVTGLERTKLTLSSTLPDTHTQDFDPGDYNSFKLANDAIIDQWAKKHTSASVSFTEKYSIGHTSKQLMVDLGVDLDFLDGINIGVDWTESQDTQPCVFEYTRTFYTTTCSSYVHPASYFSLNTGVNDVKMAFADSPTVLVQNATYGMMVLFSATSTSTNTDLGVALSLAISGHSGEMSVEQKEAVENCSFTMTVIGGTQQSSKAKTYDTGDYEQLIEDLNSYLNNKNIDKDDYKNAALLSAETSFLDSGDFAHSFVSTEYIQKTTTITTKLDVEYYLTGGYCGTFCVYYNEFTGIDPETGEFTGVTQKVVGWAWKTSVLDAVQSITAKHCGPIKIYARAEAGSVILDYYEISMPQNGIYLWMGGSSFDIKYDLQVDDVTIKSRT